MILGAAIDGAPMLFIMISAYRKPLWRTTLSEVRQRDAGSTMGLFWVLLAPALLLALYACVFIYIYKTVPAGMDKTTYLVQLFAGLLPFLAFSDGLVNGSGAFEQSRGAAQYRLSCRTRSAACGAFRSRGSSARIGAGGRLGDGNGPFAPGLVLLPLVLVLQVMFVCGVAWPLSLANLVLRDIQQVLTFLCTALMIVSPIAYAPDCGARTAEAARILKSALLFHSHLSKPGCSRQSAAYEYRGDNARPVGWRLPARFPPLPTGQTRVLGLCLTPRQLLF